MLLFGFFCCILGTTMIAIASVHDFSIQYLVMVWGFIVIILGLLFILTEAFN